MSLNEMFFGEETPPDGVAILDFSQIIMAAAFVEFGEAAKFPKISENMLRHLVLNSIKYNKKLAAKHGYTNLVVAVDNSTSGYWRRDVASYYKRNRKNDREESPFDWTGLFEAMYKIIFELETNMPYTLMNIDKVEADDHIAVIVKVCNDKNIPVLIVSSDGDFTQLHKYPNVKQWSPMFKKWVKPKISPLMDTVIKVVKGDKKDNVASIKVRGDFHTSKVEGERQPSVKSSMLDSIADNYFDDSAIEQLLTSEEWSRYKENRILIDMDYIDEDISALILKRYNSYVPAKRNRIYSYLVKNGLSKLTQHANDF